MSFSSDKPLQSNQLSISVDFPDPQDPNFLSIFSLDRKRIVDSVNTKEGALYSLEEKANFQQVFTTTDPQQFRDSYRKCFDMVDLNGGNIGAAATVAFPHNITGLFDSMLIFAACVSDAPIIYFSVVYPYVWLDSVNVNFTNPLARAITKCKVVANYLKN